MAQRGGYREGAGRKKGAATLYAEALKGEIARQVEKDAAAMIQAQIEKAKTGDTNAFNALLDRFMGKPKQEVEGDIRAALTLAFDNAFTSK